MGRYSSVQAYADNNANTRSISYDQATGGNVAANKKVVTEKVSNPYGSTAGAGSGEFHVYRHARAREMARWKELDDTKQEEQKEIAYQSKLQQDQDDEAKKTEKRRKKRQREKEAKQRKKTLKASGILSVIQANEEKAAREKTVDEDEFSYVPLAEQKKSEEQTPAEDPQTQQKEVEPTSSKDSDTAAAQDPNEIPNDGSFLERMKRQLAEAQPEETVAPPPAKRAFVESRIIDEDDDEDEGPKLPPGFS